MKNLFLLEILRKSLQDIPELNQEQLKILENNKEDFVKDFMDIVVVHTMKNKAMSESDHMRKAIKNVSGDKGGNTHRFVGI